MVRGSNPGGGEIFRTCPDRPWGPRIFLYNGYRLFPRGKERPGRDSDPSPPSRAVGHERVELYLYPPMGRTACTEPQCLYKGALYLYLTLLWMELSFRNKNGRQQRVFHCPGEFCGSGSVFGIATGYGLDGQGIESRWGRNFPYLSRPALGPTQPPVQWVRVRCNG
jgi:hypothetical protein